VFGSVKFQKSEIIRIEKTNEQQVVNKWEEDKKAREKREAERESAPKEVSTGDFPGGHMVVHAILDGKVEADLMVDTGATCVTLSPHMIDRLGLKPEQLKNTVQIEVGDGRMIPAAMIKLSKLKVGSIEAKDVDAAVILDKSSRASYGDGLLGMSFLKNFNFSVDTIAKKLFLKKRENA
jgi:clan AA aspartic protease (TIGR02281 family)